MAVSNRDRVRKGLDLLKDGLAPYVAREMQAKLGANWWQQATTGLPSNAGPEAMDTAALLALVWEYWTAVFGTKLGPFERGLVGELRGVRNRWAHEQPFTTDDTYRALDSIGRLLQAISAEQAAAVEREKQEVLRLRFEEQARQESRRAGVGATEGRPAGGLKPWREVHTPHPDVASGRYQQAEFAADLGRVHTGEGTAEYGDPTEFYRRTFLTDGLRHLLVGALQRLSGRGADPVVKLQTNFGGGKTHSMLALYHLFSGQPPGALPGVEPVLQQAGVGELPRAHRAVLVGTALNPATPRRKRDGVETRTLWGELAWQLGDAAGDAAGAYSLVADADARGANPGSHTLQELFDLFSPCLILVDEWLAFVRGLYGVDGLPAGSFDANLSFVQSLTEAAMSADRTLLVATLPASDIEVGGTAGREALARLENTFARVEAVWRPASIEEGFEIVRRRLFEPISDPTLYTARDAVVNAFAGLYRDHTGEFPPGCREGGYTRRLQAAYPIHPELFDRLFEDWSSLERFQRTRGVLRLMAAVIHALWERDDRNLLILPGSLPMDDPGVQYELTRYLDDNWVPIIESDVDGPQSLPLQLDRDNPALARFSATRRVARTLYLGSAPTVHAANRGLDDRQVKLGCAQPGESVAIFGDALRRLSDQATYLYVDGALLVLDAAQRDAPGPGPRGAAPVQARPGRGGDSRAPTARAAEARRLCPRAAVPPGQRRRARRARRDPPGHPRPRAPPRGEAARQPRPADGRNLARQPRHEPAPEQEHAGVPGARPHAAGGAGGRGAPVSGLEVHLRRARAA
jgi:hypothetical protein